MGYSIVLCEGETDQALIGCYLEKTNHWKYEKTKEGNLFPKESINWFKDPRGMKKGIWAVGGDDFCSAVDKVFMREKQDHIIDKLVVVTDHDDQFAETDRVSMISETIKARLSLSEELVLTVNNWSEISFTNSFGKVSMEALYLLVPAEETGALETFMLDALSEQNIDKEHVISESRRFVREFKSESYLKHRRDKIKAELGVSMSVFNPDRVFTTMKELIDSVDWSQFVVTHKQFGLLKSI